jgi:hypothetical protein
MTKTKQINSSEIVGRTFFRRSLATEDLTIKDTDIVFHVQALSDRALSHIKREAEGPDGKPDELRLMNLFVKFALVGVDNLIDQDGEQVKFSTETINILGKDVQCAPDDFVEMLSREIRGQIALIITEISELSTVEQKRIEFFRSGGAHK